MLNSVELRNFGPLDHIKWKKLGRINLLIGSNGCGKTFLLKAMYAAVRTLEEYKRGRERRSAAEILADKLYWTFQAEKIGDLVAKGTYVPLSYKMKFDDNDFSYSFGKDTSRQILTLENDIPPRSSNSVFLPAKEVLSLHSIILESREQDKVFGFDDTYLDLAKALRLLPKGGKNYAEFAASRRHLESMLGGKVEFDEASGCWQFKKGKQRFPVGVTAEGVKKIAILDTLLGNRYLDTRSVIFIDEPEAALHPAAISRFLDIIANLSERGIQFFLASHSYFVIKKLFLIAQAKNISIPTLSEDGKKWIEKNLQDGMPDNPIIEESIRLYKQEVELALR